MFVKRHERDEVLQLGCHISSTQVPPPPKGCMNATAIANKLLKSPSLGSVSSHTRNTCSLWSNQTLTTTTTKNTKIKKLPPPILACTKPQPSSIHRCIHPTFARGYGCPKQWKHGSQLAKPDKACCSLVPVRPMSHPSFHRQLELLLDVPSTAPCPLLHA